MEIVEDSHKTTNLEHPHVADPVHVSKTATVSRESRETIGDIFVDDPRISCRDVNVYYGEKQAIKNISLDIGKNEVIAMIGPSGCGKSTFLRCLNRMNDTIIGCRVTGDINMDGQNINSKKIDVVPLRAQVSMVFQKPNPFPKTVFDNIAYGLRVNGVRDKALIAERVEQSLKQAALWEEVKDRLNNTALGLSGGQQQRLCIARALAVAPEVLLMDEPCSALDPIATQKIEELIHELKENYTIIIVTHNMQQAARVSDVTAFFYLGKLIEVGETDGLFTRPKFKQTEDYITGRFG